MKIGTNNISACMSVLACVSICSFLCVCECVLYSQCSQLRHVVEAGQGDEGDVIVVESAGQRNRKKEKWEKREQLLENADQWCHLLVWRFKF